MRVARQAVFVLIAGTLFTLFITLRCYSLTYRKSETTKIVHYYRPAREDTRININENVSLFIYLFF